MAQIRDRPDAQMLQSMVLRSMQQAVYSPDNIGHFGLAYEAYAHFTSPIRRYPDLLTHRAIYAILQGKKYQPAAGHGVELSTGSRNAARAMQQSDDETRGRSREQRRDLGRTGAALLGRTNAAPTKPRATSKRGSSAISCATSSARSTAAW